MTTPTDNEPLAFDSGRFIPAGELHIHVADAGFVLGTTVTEQIRTFGGRLFRLERHLDRLFRSLEIVGVGIDFSADQLDALARQLAAHNHALLEAGDDLGLSLFVTPGVYGAFAKGCQPGPRVCMHTYPVAFDTFARLYEEGERLAIPSVRQVPPECWPRELKCRSRMHYYLADQEVRRSDAGSRAILLDADGSVTEATTASLIAYHEGEGFFTPPDEQVLPGISLSVARELAAELGISWTHRKITPQDLATADEVMLVGTSPCVWPCTFLGGAPIGRASHRGMPGPIFKKLLEAWSVEVRVDIAAQAQRFAQRGIL